LNVLLVDDSALIRQLAAKYIHNEGYTPLAASGAEEALSILKTETVDLILMDVEMPHMNGFELTRVIRQTIPHWIPIIFLTSKTEDKFLVEGIESGGDDYIYKPINEVILTSKLKAMARIVEIKLKLDEANEKLSQLTQTDSLTGLINRRGMKTILKRLWKNSLNSDENFSVVFLDIDYFKPYNDNYGHPKGDKCLESIGTFLANNIRKGSDMAVRYGGEEFLLILPNTNIKGAINVVNSIKVKLNEEALPHLHRPDELSHITVSFGISSSVFATNISELLQQADIAMYKAKDLGRNTYFNYEDLIEKQ